MIYKIIDLIVIVSLCGYIVDVLFPEVSLGERIVVSFAIVGVLSVIGRKSHAENNS